MKDALRRNTDEAIARGVFGVPTLMVGRRAVLGQRRDAMCADYLAQGGRWTDPEYERVAALPVGAERKARPGRSASRSAPVGDAQVATRLGSALDLVRARNAERALDLARRRERRRAASRRGT